MENIVTINETATLNFMPDTAVITINIKGRDKDYNHAVELAAMYLAEVTDCLVETGVQRDSVKTGSLNVVPVYDYNKNKATLSAYECSYMLSLELEYNSKHLAKNSIQTLKPLITRGFKTLISFFKFFVTSPGSVLSDWRIYFASEACEILLSVHNNLMKLS